MWLDGRYYRKSLYSYFHFLKGLNVLLHSCYCQRNEKSIIKIYGICFTFNVFLYHDSFLHLLNCPLVYDITVLLFTFRYKFTRCCKIYFSYLLIKGKIHNTLKRGNTDTIYINYAYG